MPPVCNDGRYLIIITYRVFLAKYVYAAGELSKLRNLRVFTVISFWPMLMMLMSWGEAYVR